MLQREATGRNVSLCLALPSGDDVTRISAPWLLTPQMHPCWKPAAVSALQLRYRASVSWMKLIRLGKRWRLSTGCNSAAACPTLFMFWMIKLLRCSIRCLYLVRGLNDAPLLHGPVIYAKLWCLLLIFVMSARICLAAQRSRFAVHSCDSRFCWLAASVSLSFPRADPLSLAPSRSATHTSRLDTEVQDAELSPLTYSVLAVSAQTFESGSPPEGAAPRAPNVLGSCAGSTPRCGFRLVQLPCEPRWLAQCLIR